PAGTATPVVLLDEPALGVAVGLFARLRDELWEVPATWIVSVQPSEAAVLARPPADVFFEVSLELGPLSPDDMRSLLERRLPAGALPAAVLDELSTTGHPRHALESARRVLDGVSWVELTRASRERADLVA